MFPHDAPCRDLTDVMFPKGHTGRPGHRADPHQAALELCAQCPYHVECRERWEAEPADIQAHGVWFGTTPDMRRATRGLRRNQTTGLGRGRLHVRCDNCGTVFTGGVRSRYCPTCRRTRAVTADSQVDRNREAKARQRARRVEQGLCADCGRHRHRAGKSTCVHCAQVAAVARDRRRVAQEQGGAA